jgi:hypothetical protein
MEMLPQLGDERTRCTERLGAPRTSQPLGDGLGLVQQYRSRLGPLTVLFVQERSVAFHLRYVTPQPHTAALRAALTELLAPEGRSRLLVDDEGWLLVAPGCSEAALQRFAYAVLSPERQAQLAAWAQG